ncbi:MAG: aspartyl protease family protein [Vulcanimicrobiaceae bacterium]
MGFAGRASMLCALALPLLGASPQPPLERVLERMRASGGTPFRAHIVSAAQRRDGTVTVTARNETSGLRFLAERCNDAICRGDYFDGNRLFSVNMNGTALPRSQREELYLRALRTVTSAAFLEPSFVKDGGHLSDGGIVQIGGTHYRRLNVTATDALPMEVYVDPQTWLVAMARDADEDAEFTFHDYRRVGPYLLPFSIDRDGHPFERYDTRAIAPSPLDMPRGLVPAFDTSGPMVLDRGSSLPVGNCSIAGVAARCLIDTGNSGISMSLELAERLNAPVVGAWEVNGLGRYATEVVTAGPLRIGNATFPQARYVVLHDIQAYGYDLVLGADILANANVTIDYGAHTALFSDPSKANYGSGIPLAFENFVPVVPVKLGALTADLAVDTGDQSTINLAYAYYSEHPDLFQATGQTRVSGVGGDSVELLGQIPDARVGSFTVTSPSVGTTRTLEGTAHGHLGAGFLAHFRIVLDYARRQLLLFARHGDTAVQRTP